ncbi:hypothetical protein [Achromobacter sp. UBA2119]|uniref:hypothetical protein n=1 Tax=Achromobacter sp. UBA2119 TaxID=1945911 RepID=UPI00257D582A|nr:hypothetical protein [Achromobacter sp. UBA2119]
MPTQTDLRFAFAAGENCVEAVNFTLPEVRSETIPLEEELANAEPAVHFGRARERAR